MSDLTVARWRAFGLSLLFLPFLVMPWVGAFIVESVVRPGGIGWRWGIGMLVSYLPLKNEVRAFPVDLFLSFF